GGPSSTLAVMEPAPALRPAYNVTSATRFSFVSLLVVPKRPYTLSIELRLNVTKAPLTGALSSSVNVNLIVAGLLAVTSFPAPYCTSSVNLPSAGPDGSSLLVSPPVVSKVTLFDAISSPLSL